MCPENPHILRVNNKDHLVSRGWHTKVLLGPPSEIRSFKKKKIRGTTNHLKCYDDIGCNMKQVDILGYLPLFTFWEVHISISMREMMHVRLQNPSRIKGLSKTPKNIWF